MQMKKSPCGFPVGVKIGYLTESLDERWKRRLIRHLKKCRYCAWSLEDLSTVLDVFLGASPVSDMGKRSERVIEM